MRITLDFRVPKILTTHYHLTIKLDTLIFWLPIDIQSFAASLVILLGLDLGTEILPEKDLCTLRAMMVYDEQLVKEIIVWDSLNPCFPCNDINWDHMLHGLQSLRCENQPLTVTWRHLWCAVVTMVAWSWAGVIGDRIWWRPGEDGWNQESVVIRHLNHLEHKQSTNYQPSAWNLG